MAVPAIPPGLHAVIPHLVVAGGLKAIEFYQQAFGATLLAKMMLPDGQSLMHAHLTIGEGHFFLVDEMPGKCDSKSPLNLGGCSASFYLYVADVDASVSRAVAAGARLMMPPTDMFWGDRFSSLADPFGHVWSLATHKEDVTPEQMRERAKEMFAKMGNEQGK